jgi:CheY-like chemotaxis protein
LLTSASPPFDLVLCDVVMPGAMNGISLAIAVRQRWPGMPILLMTGYAAEIHRALSAGFDVLPKPCAPDTLLAALHATLDMQRGTAGAAD